MSDAEMEEMVMTLFNRFPPADRDHSLHTLATQPGTVYAHLKQRKGWGAPPPGPPGHQQERWQRAL